jgi:KDO2-lipid IV(A) lauroyltransferase
LEYGLFLGAQGLIFLLPLKVMYSLARMVGELLYLVDTKHRNTAKKNISLVYKQPLNDPKARAMARSVFKNLAKVVVEFMVMPKDFNTDFGRKVMIELEGRDKIEKVLAAGKGLIFVTGHTGNWELLGAYVSSCVVPMSCVARRFRNPYLNRAVQARRQEYRQEIIHKKGALLKISRILKRGGVVAFLLDQHAGRDELKVDFMGTPAYTHSGPGRLAVRYQVPIMAGFCYRLGSGFQYKGYMDDPIYPDPDRDPEEETLRMTRYANERIGHFIKEHPEQWMWLHRRWR